MAGPTITFGGLASGLDTNALIDGLMAAEKVPLDRLRTEKAKVDSAKDTLSSLISKLATLKSAASDLADPLRFSSFAATSSGSAVVASVTGAPAAGAFSVQVTGLAHEQRTYADPQSSSTTALGLGGTLTLQVGSGSPVDLTIDPTDSLGAIASKLNSSGARVSAAVVYDGTNYRLQVRGLDTGAANALTFTESGFSLGLSTPANTVQAASDATMLVDGFTVTRSSNQVSGVIPGVTLALTATTSSPVTIDVEPDATALAGKITKLVDAYNAVVNAGHSAAGFGTTPAANPKLAGDSAVRTALEKLARVIGAPVTGATGQYGSLPSIGLGSNRDGTILLDQAKLTAALAADPSAVAKLFVTDPAQGATGAMADLVSAVDSMIHDSSSLLQSRADGLGALSARLDKDATRMSDRMDAYEELLRKRFTDLELLMSQFKAQGGALDSMVTNTNK